MQTPYLRIQPWLRPSSYEIDQDLKRYSLETGVTSCWDNNESSDTFLMVSSRRRYASSRRSLAAFPRPKSDIVLVPLILLTNSSNLVSTMTMGTVHGHWRSVTMFDTIMYLTFLIRHTKDPLYTTFTETLSSKWRLDTNPVNLSQYHLGPWLLASDSPNCMNSFVQIFRAQMHAKKFSYLVEIRIAVWYVFSRRRI